MPPCIQFLKVVQGAYVTDFVSKTNRKKFCVSVYVCNKEYCKPQESV